MKRKQKTNAGFTLIETLIYVALFVIMLGGSLGAVYQIIQSSNAANAKMIMNDEANFLLRKINWALAGASNVSVPTPQKLTVYKATPPPGGNPIVFDLNGGNLRIARGTGAPTVLNSANISVASLSFQKIAEAGRPDAIKTSFKINSQEFETLKYLRQ